MTQPKGIIGWAQLSSTFEEARTAIPRKKQKLATVEKDCFLESDIIGVRKSNNAHSLSKLIAACEPAKRSDLSMSRQKQKELDDWFVKHTCTEKPRILLLTGPSGCGKTAALKVIAKEYDYEILEWITPPDSLPDESYNFSRQSDKFFDFVIRATRYNSVFDTNRRRLLLVKDIPNVYLMKEDMFFTLVEDYFQYGKEPFVFICTDGSDAKILKTLFPSHIRERYHIDHIRVNSTTQTAMKNMLKRISVILNSRASQIINVKQSNIDEVLTHNIGDVRSAILNLIFNSLKVPDGNRKHGCESREDNLGLLHAIGRVINPKRIQADGKSRFVHDPEEMVSYFSSQSTTFLNFLQENYMNTMCKIDEIDASADILSLSDTLSRGWQDPNLCKLNLSFCIRGIMVNNKTLVTGWNPVRKPHFNEITLSRNLATAEENFYKSLIRPKEIQDFSNIDNTIIE